MKQAWEKTETSILIFKQELEELLEMLPISPKFLKKTSSLNKAWKKAQISLNEMDKFITPVKSVDIKSNLLSNEKFREIWVFWKDYLNEQHSIVMRSRAELMALKRMLDITSDNPDKAIFYLEYAMSRIEKNFYKVDEQTEAKHHDKNGIYPIVIKLPEKYKNENADPLDGLAN